MDQRKGYEVDGAMRFNKKVKIIVPSFNLISQSSEDQHQEYKTPANDFGEVRDALTLYSKHRDEESLTRLGSVISRLVQTYEKINKAVDGAEHMPVMDVAKAFTRIGKLSPRYQFAQNTRPSELESTVSKVKQMSLEDYSTTKDLLRQYRDIKRSHKASEDAIKRILNIVDGE